MLSLKKSLRAGKPKGLNRIANIEPVMAGIQFLHRCLSLCWIAT